MGLGWVLLPVLVIADDGSRAVGSDNALLQILVAGVVGGATGLILGVAQLGCAVSWERSSARSALDCSRT